MAQTKLISVIVAVYNAEAYLERCIESLINQTYKNLEILLIDDGSKDASLEICNRYAQRDGRIRVFSQSNKGPAAARNIGLSNMSGKYWTTLDADDWIDTTAYETVLNKAEETDADMVLFGYRFVDEHHVWPMPKSKLRNGYYDENACRLIARDFIYRKGDKINPFVWTRLIKVEVIRENNIWFDEELRRSEDYCILAQLHNHIKSMYIMDNEIFLNYWQNPCSITFNYVHNYWYMIKKIYTQLMQINSIQCDEDMRFRIESMLVYRAIISLRNEKNNRSGVFKIMRNAYRILNDDELQTVLKRIDMKTIISHFGRRGIFLKTKNLLILFFV